MLTKKTWLGNIVGTIPADRFPGVLLGVSVVWLMMSGCAKERADEGAIVEDAPRDAESSSLTASPSGKENAADSGGELRELLHRLALIVAATDDSNQAARHFDELLDSDFYVRYGVSRLSGLTATVAYERYLGRYLQRRTQFLRSMTKTSLVISTGAALQMIARSDVDGQTFAISAASLGLSTASVRASLRGIEAIGDLRAARRTGVLMKFTREAGRYAKFSGWVYTASEELLIVLVAHDLEIIFKEHLDRQATRKALGDAIGEFLDAVNEGGTFEDAIGAHSAAWEDYRNFLYRSLVPYDEEFERCVSPVARRAKLLDDMRIGMLTKLPEYPELKAYAEKRSGSIDSYAKYLLFEDREEIVEDAAACLATYNSQREAGMREIYEDNRRSSRLLEGIDLNSIRGRKLARASDNRIQTYEDELDVLAAVAHRIRELDLEANLIEAEIAVVQKMMILDSTLFGSSGLADSREP